MGARSTITVVVAAFAGAIPAGLVATPAHADEPAAVETAEALVDVGTRETFEARDATVLLVSDQGATAEGGVETVVASTQELGEALSMSWETYLAHASDRTAGFAVPAAAEAAGLIAEGMIAYANFAAAALSSPPDGNDMIGSHWDLVDSAVEASLEAKDIGRDLANALVLGFVDDFEGVLALYLEIDPADPFYESLSAVRDHAFFLYDTARAAALSAVDDLSEYRSDRFWSSYEASKESLNITVQGVVGTFDDFWEAYAAVREAS